MERNRQVDVDAPESSLQWMSATAAVAGAVGVSICCIAPFVLLALGMSGTYLVEAVEPYRPYIIAGEIAAYMWYRRVRERSACDVDKGEQQLKVVVFWVALALVVGSVLALAW